MISQSLGPFWYWRLASRVGARISFCRLEARRGRYFCPIGCRDIDRMVFIGCYQKIEIAAIYFSMLLGKTVWNAQRESAKRNPLARLRVGASSLL